MATSRDQAQNIVFTKQPFVKDVGPRKIKSMQFRVQSASEISKMAEVQVGKGHYYDSNRKPIENGSLDPRMRIHYVSSKTEPLKKVELMKKIVKKCNSKAVKCSECGYMNGSVKK